MLSQLTVCLMLVAGQEKPKQEFPDLAKLCPTNWGKVLYDRKTGKIVLHGHETWDAIGHVRKDGKVLVVWRLLSDKDKTGPGLYDVQEDGTLKGVWGWYGEVFFDADGNLHGETKDDRIFRVEPMPGKQPMMPPAADMD